ncbi:MAG: hypothetical protein U0L73_00815 [Ruminococcus bromii]|nr:hypothetical protein [Ruminococcus bromii]MEE1172662.1 hypothetical protein [Ruminococcus sp.]
MADLIIYDDSINDTSETIKTLSSELQTIMDNYIDTVTEIKTNAVKSGDTSDKLEVFIQYASKLRSTISSVGEEISMDMSTYLEEIDTKDEYLY